MARKKKIEQIQEISETQNVNSFESGEITGDTAPDKQPQVKQINMNQIAQAAFNELGKMNAYPDKPLDEFTLKEHRQAIAHLKGVIRKQMEGDTFEVNPAYTSLLCMLALCHASSFDLNKYFKISAN